MHKTTQKKAEMRDGEKLSLDVSLDTPSPEVIMALLVARQCINISPFRPKTVGFAFPLLLLFSSSVMSNPLQIHGL